MATVISIADRLAAKAHQKAPSLKPRTIVVMFTAVALAMTAAAILIGVNSWSDAVTLVVLISVVALLKLALANLMFFAMLRADEQVDPRLIAEPEPEPPPRRAAKVVVARPLPARARQSRNVMRRVEVAGEKALATGPLIAPSEQRPRR
jgi:hypothetical protein